MYETSVTRIAPKACIPCRERKRKCDRTTPSCSLCYRLGRPCQYGLMSPSPSSASSDGGQPASRKRRVSPSKAKISSILHEGGLDQTGVSNTITEHLLKAVGKLSDIRTIAARYFTTIHRWLPIVSESLYYERLPSTFTKSQADINLLSLSIVLITKIPNDEDLESMLSLYALVKSSIAIIEAANINTVETVQARLLVSLFEAGHGMPAAYISIASTTRAAAAIGINETINDPCSPASEEGLRLWWGIVMLDRYYALEHGEDICATEGLGTPRHLPRDGNVWDQKLLSSNDPLPMSTPSSVRVGPFARQAQVSHVVNLLLMHLHSQKGQGGDAFDKEESDQIARTLLSFSRLLPEETPQPWPRYCGAIGMCYGSLMVLHASREKYLPSACSDEFLTQTIDAIGLVCRKFNARITQVDPDAVSPFPPHSIALAARAHLRLWRDTGEMRHLEEADEFIAMLRFFGGRWLGSGKYLALIEGERGAALEMGMA